MLHILSVQSPPEMYFKLISESLKSSLLKGINISNISYQLDYKKAIQHNANMQITQANKMLV